MSGGQLKTECISTICGSTLICEVSEIATKHKQED